jgi:beta-fructofuranosidase
MNQNETLRGDAAAAGLAKTAQGSRWYPNYHIAAVGGWINDPNGLVRFGDRYHVFYQHHPYSPEGGPMHWGHVSSADLAHWRREPIALAPDQPYETGCFSGSAVDDNGTLTLIYTAHNDNCPVKETQCVARSTDGGRTFVKSPLNPVIPMYPAEGAPDFRDPKVWRQGDRWLLVAGTVHEGRGAAVLYESRDLERWDYRGVLCESPKVETEKDDKWRTLPRSQGKRFK